MKNKKICYILIGLVIIVISGTACYFIVNEIIRNRETSAVDQQTPQGGVSFVLDPSAKSYSGEEPENKSGDAPGIKIPGYGSVKIAADSTNVEMILLNPEGNPCYFTFEIVLIDTNESLYTSQMVEPSYCIEEINLSRPLERGEYEATLKIRAYELESLAAMNSANVEFKLIAR